MKPLELIAGAARGLQELMEKRLHSSNTRLKKSATLIAYWIRDYIRLLNMESSKRKSFRRYGRGDIVKVHLGFRIGNEEGGLHYGIVLDRHDGVRNSILTIVPMTSVKPQTDIQHLNFKDVYLGNEVTDAIIAKLKKSSLNLCEEVVDASESLSRMEDGDVPKDAASMRKTIDGINERLRIQRSQTEQVAKMKQGGIALCNQIVTVSKLRIYDPCSSKDLLYGIHLSAESLNKIDEKIKELYLNH